MRAIVFDGEKAAVETDVEVRATAPTEVRVRMVAAGVCHSDLSVIDGTIPFPPPVVMGHEGAGVIEEVGSEVKDLEARRPRRPHHARLLRLAAAACDTGNPTLVPGQLRPAQPALHRERRPRLPVRRQLGLRRGHGGQRPPGHQDRRRASR